MDYFDEKVFIVTGASSGIGRAIAAQLIDRGARVAGMARSADKLEDLQRQLYAGERFLPVAGDVTRQEDCKRVVDETVGRFGHLDGLIHNAGITMRGAIPDTQVDVYKSLMETNFYSLIYLLKHCLDPIKQRKGHVAAVTSMQAMYSVPQTSGYAASKHAAQGFVDCLRIELMPAGVHVMAILPGFVKTDLSLNAMRDDGKRYGKMDANIARGLPPEAVAKDVLRGIEKRKRMIFPSGVKEKFALFLSKYAPAVLDRLLSKTDISGK